MKGVTIHIVTSNEEIKADKGCVTRLGHKRQVVRQIQTEMVWALGSLLLNHFFNVKSSVSTHFHLSLSQHCHLQ